MTTEQIREKLNRIKKGVETEKRNLARLEVLDAETQHRFRMFLAATANQQALELITKRG